MGTCLLGTEVEVVNFSSPSDRLGMVPSCVTWTAACDSTDNDIRGRLSRGVEVVAACRQDTSGRLATDV